VAKPRDFALISFGLTNADPDKRIIALDDERIRCKEGARFRWLIASSCRSVAGLTSQPQLASPDPKGS
jgi:hypothetical protein